MIAIFVIALLICAGAGFIYWHRSGKAEFFAQPTLFTDEELRLLLALEEAVGKEVRIQARVNLSHLVHPNDALKERAYLRQYQQLTHWEVDFVLCDFVHGVPLCAIVLSDEELDERDLRYLACEQAGIALLVEPFAEGYHCGELRRELLPYILQKPVVRAVESAEPTFDQESFDEPIKEPRQRERRDEKGSSGRRDPVFSFKPDAFNDEQDERQPEICLASLISEPAAQKESPSKVIPQVTTVQPVPEVPPTTEPHCPQCGGELVRRVAQRGEHAGREFLACAAFPDCRYAVLVE